MLLCLIVFILASFGVFGFYIDNIIILAIGSIACIIELLLAMISDQIKYVFTAFISLILGFIVAIIHGLNLLNVLLVSLCFENIIMFLSQMILLFVINYLNVETKITCPYCNAENNPRSKHCHMCMKKLESNFDTTEKHKFGF